MRVQYQEGVGRSLDERTVRRRLPQHAATSRFRLASSSEDTVTAEVHEYAYCGLERGRLRCTAGLVTSPE